MKKNRVKIVKNELINKQLQQNVQVTIELQSLIGKYDGDVSMLLVEG